MKTIKILIISLSLLLLAAASHAAPWTQQFRNDYRTDNIYLFITDGATAFEPWVSLPGDWQTDIWQSDILSASGSPINSRRIFSVRFSDRGTFTLQWAELLNGSIQGAGSLFAVNGRFVGSSNEFTANIPTPITGTVWLLGAGLVGLVFIRRKLPSYRS